MVYILNYSHCPILVSSVGDGRSAALVAEVSSAGGGGQLGRWAVSVVLVEAWLSSGRCTEEAMLRREPVRSTYEVPARGCTVLSF